MKKFILFLSILFVTVAVKAQMLRPISWTYSAKKAGDKTYELHLTATIQAGWHLYSQTQPEDAIAIPTTFTFNNNPLVILDGALKEIGKLEKFHDSKLDVSANQYSRQVDFVQVIKLKAGVKTNVTGSVEFQTCDDQKCLPPRTEKFVIQIL